MDRRTIWAILLMMVIAIVPAIFIKRPPRPVAGAADSTLVRDSGSVAAPVDTGRGPSRSAADTLRAGRDSATAAAAQAPRTIRVTSPLYTYGISTVGGRLVEARLERYHSMAPGERGTVAQILPPRSEFLGLTLVAGRDSVSLRDWPFTASADSLAAGAGPLHLSATRGAVTVDLTYTFRPDDYRFDVVGQVRGVGPNGGLLLVDMPPTLANTEANLEENHRALALVTKRGEADRTDFSGLKPGEPKTISGPLEWTAVKSKYFVAALLAFDSAGGRIAGATATAR